MRDLYEADIGEPITIDVTEPDQPRIGPVDAFARAAKATQRTVHPRSVTVMPWIWIVLGLICSYSGGAALWRNALLAARTAAKL